MAFLKADDVLTDTLQMFSHSLKPRRSAHEDVGMGEKNNFRVQDLVLKSVHLNIYFRSFNMKIHATLILLSLT